MQNPPGKSSPTEAQISGTLIHSTVEQWIKSGLWNDPDSNEVVADQFRTSAEAKDLPLGRTRILAAYLENLLRDLRNVLDAGITEASAEKEVIDSASRIRGKIDILCVGPGYVAVVDIKTGRTANDQGELLEEIGTQLAVYCWLVRELAPRPKAVIVSIADGVRALPMSEEVSASTVANLTELRLQAVANPATTPGADVCKFCAVRPVCGPHWSEVAAGKIIDAVEGVITRVEPGAGGQTMIQFSSGSTESVMRIRQGATIEGTLVAGANLRAVRVRKKDPESNRWSAWDSALIYCTEAAFQNEFF